MIPIIATSEIFFIFSYFIIFCMVIKFNNLMVPLYHSTFECFLLMSHSLLLLACGCLSLATGFDSTIRPDHIVDITEIVFVSKTSFYFFFGAIIMLFYPLLNNITINLVFFTTIYLFTCFTVLISIYAWDHITALLSVELPVFCFFVLLYYFVDRTVIVSIVILFPIYCIQYIGLALFCKSTGTFDFLDSYCYCMLANSVEANITSVNFAQVGVGLLLMFFSYCINFMLLLFITSAILLHSRNDNVVEIVIIIIFIIFIQIAQLFVIYNLFVPMFLFFSMLYNVFFFVLVLCSFIALITIVLPIPQSQSSSLVIISIWFICFSFLLKSTACGQQFDLFLSYCTIIALGFVLIGFLSICYCMSLSFQSLIEKNILAYLIQFRRLFTSSFFIATSACAPSGYYFSLPTGFFNVWWASIQYHSAHTLGPFGLLCIYVLVISVFLLLIIFYYISNSYVPAVINNISTCDPLIVILYLFYLTFNFFLLGSQFYCEWVNFFYTPSQSFIIVKGSASHQYDDIV